LLADTTKPSVRAAAETAMSLLALIEPAKVTALRRPLVTVA
jgi:hypothetical protein